MKSISGVRNQHARVVHRGHFRPTGVLGLRPDDGLRNLNLAHSSHLIFLIKQDITFF